MFLVMLPARLMFRVTIPTLCSRKKDFVCRNGGTPDYWPASFFPYSSSGSCILISGEEGTENARHDDLGGTRPRRFQGIILFSMAILNPAVTF